PPGDYRPRDFRVDRALHRDHHRALRRRVPVLALAGAGGGAAAVGEVRRLRPRGAGEASRREYPCGDRRVEREARREDPARTVAEGAVHARRRREGSVERERGPARARRAAKRAFGGCVDREGTGADQDESVVRARALIAKAQELIDGSQLIVPSSCCILSSRCPSAMDSGAELFRANLALIDRVIERVCAKNRLLGPDADDFASEVRLELMAGEYSVLRSWEGRSPLATFLTIVVQRLLINARVRERGRWHASHEAQRMGRAAVELERLVQGDGRSLDG